MAKSFPKILILSNVLNLRNGGGITLYNLFKGWPQEDIIVASTKIDEGGLALCNKYYRFGYDETQRPWPLNKYQPYYKSEEVIVKDIKVSSNFSTQYGLSKSSYNERFKVFVENLLHFLGIYYLLFPFKPSSKFYEWIKKESPDIIYTQFGSVESILFMNKLVKKIDVPLVIHIMDDWPSTINRNGFERIFWKGKVEKILKNLFSKSSALMSIGQGMSDVYKKRYGLDFVPFQNCIDPEFWSKYKKQDWSIDGTFKILYAGRIGVGTFRSVLKIAKAIEKLGNEGLDIEFHIHSPAVPSRFLKKVKLLKYTKIKDFIPHEKFPEKLASVDLLALPMMDFTGRSLKYIRLSMPTKMPEYFASGTPILLFAHETTAIVKYAQTENWGEIVTENSVDALTRVIKNISGNKEKREILSKNATALIDKYHSERIVREEFRQALINVVENSKI